jgi:hypothetical protein
MIERLLIWVLDTFYPKQIEPPKPIVSVNVNQKQTVKKTVARPREAAVKKPAVVAKTVAKKRAKQ